MYLHTMYEMFVITGLSVCLSVRPCSLNLCYYGWGSVQEKIGEHFNIRKTIKSVAKAYYLGTNRAESGTLSAKHPVL